MCRGTVGFILEGMGGSKRGIIYQTPSNTIYKEKLSTDIQKVIPVQLGCQGDKAEDTERN